MMLPVVIAAAGLSALVAASPVAMPEITAAPSLDAVDKRAAYSSCKISSTVFTNKNQFGAATETVTTQACTCAQNESPDVTTSLVTGSYGVVTTLAVCYDATTTISSASSVKTSSQPSVQAKQVHFGDASPEEVVLNIGSDCVNGCKSSGSVTASYIPTSAYTTYKGTPAVYAGPTPMVISWTLTDSALPQNNMGTYFGALGVMAANASTNSGPFNYPGGGSGGSDGLTTQYQGPALVGMQRFAFEGDTPVLMDSLSISFSSEIEIGSDPLGCSSIEGPMATALGMIPEVGAFFGIFGSILCSALGA